MIRVRDYQPKNNPYWLPRDIYMQTIWFIRGYDRRAGEVARDPFSSPPPPDGQPKGTKTGNPTATLAVILADAQLSNRIVDEALSELPEEYRDAIRDNVLFGAPWPRINGVPMHSKTTYSKYKHLFLFKVAKKLNLI